MTKGDAPSNLALKLFEALRLVGRILARWVSAGRGKSPVCLLAGIHSGSHLLPRLT